jgi:acetyl esterase/lipase
MRGIVSEKLVPFLAQANEALAESKKQAIEMSPELVRGNLDKLAALMGQGPALSFVKDREITLEKCIIPVRVYSPDPSQALPVVIHYHGGGHMCGSVALYDPICRKVAEQSRCIVISVEYRLAPEHPYPEGLDDCRDVLIHYQTCLAELKFTDALYIMGDSAGGAICTTLAMLSQQDKRLTVDKQILIYPSVDYTAQQESYTENGTGFLLENDKISWYFEQYFQTYSDVKAASPLYGEITHSLPETLIITAGCDPLRDEGIAYAKALAAAGVSVQHHQFDGLTHAYMLLEVLVEEECQQTYQMISDFIAQ